MTKPEPTKTAEERFYFVVLIGGLHGRAGVIINITQAEASPLLEAHKIRPASPFDCQIAGLIF